MKPYISFLTTGRKCDTCTDGFYKLDESKAKGCSPCGCDESGSIVITTCDQVTGKFARYNCIQYLELILQYLELL